MVLRFLSPHYKHFYITFSRYTVKCHCTCLFHSRQCTARNLQIMTTRIPCVKSTLAWIHPGTRYIPTTSYMAVVHDEYQQYEILIDSLMTVWRVCANDSILISPTTVCFAMDTNASQCTQVDFDVFPLLSPYTWDPMKHISKVSKKRNSVKTGQQTYTYMQTNLYSAKIVETNQRRWRRVTRQQKQTGRNVTLVDAWTLRVCL